jgi:hypothetical protein
LAGFLDPNKPDSFSNNPVEGAAGAGALISTLEGKINAVSVFSFSYLYVFYDFHP